ncbi:MAG: MOSC domain-containing protein [Mycobacterium leprae]
MSIPEAPWLCSLQVGLPRNLDGAPGSTDPMERPWQSGVYKEPVAGPVWLGRTGLNGDGQADMENHGGPDKAVMVNAAVHYPLWEAELGLPSIPYGALGENFTVVGATEADVCLGDVYAVGEARVQISQPRQPCWKMGRRLGVREVPMRIKETGRSGWYLRVLQEGMVAAGDRLILLERPFPQWSVARINQLLYSQRADQAALQSLADCPAVAERLRAHLVKQIAMGPKAQ